MKTLVASLICVIAITASADEVVLLSGAMVTMHCQRKDNNNECGFANLSPKPFDVILKGDDPKQITGNYEFVERDGSYEIHGVVSIVKYIDGDNSFYQFDFFVFYKAEASNEKFGAQYLGSISSKTLSGLNSISLWGNNIGTDDNFFKPLIVLGPAR